MVYGKIDTYSVMLRNYSAMSVFDKLGIDYDCITELLKSEFACNRQGVSTYEYQYSGIKIQIRAFYLMQIAPDKNVFSEEVPEIRLEITGTGLDYLRNIGFDPDQSFTDITFWSDDIKAFTVTRCDFAFDYVNLYDFQFRAIFDDMLSFSQDHRVNVGRTSGCSFDLKLGSQMTLYLGSVASDRYLRIYDKKLERFGDGPHDPNKIPQSFFDNGDQNINSWFRIELQTRRAKAMEYLFNCNGDFGGILGDIFKNFSVRNREGEILPSFAAIFDQKQIPLIIQNKNFVASKAVLHSAEDYIFTSAFTSLILYLSVHDIDHLYVMLQLHLKNIFTDPVFHRKQLTLQSKLHRLMNETGLTFNQLNLDINKNGYFQLKEH